MTKFRSKGTSTVVWILMGMLVLGLGGLGAQQNLGGSSSDVGRAGKVKVTSQEYELALRNEIQAFSQQTGRAVTAPEAKQIGIPQAVLSRLMVDASLADEAARLGVGAGDKAVAEQILGIQAFRGIDGRFDANAYKMALRNQGLSERNFENQVRADVARSLIQQAVTDGVKPAAITRDLSTAWLLESRDFKWQELTAADLAAPVAAPDQPTLEAWHKANADRFTAPELRKITYAWITPDMIENKVQVDEQALRDLYQERIDEFEKPERRLVEKLVFQDKAAAEAAKAKLQSGETDFEKLAAERGLSLTDIDMGEMTKEQLGAAGDAVFALDQPGVAGPIDSPLGPVLYQMNAILEPISVPFEQAKTELRGEAALDRARRQIEDLRNKVDDLVAGGATLEDLAKDTEMEVGKIDWSSKVEAEPGSIAAYPVFRDLAAKITQQDFPELHDLDDGGIFVMRLDEIVPPTLIPFAEVEDKVRADWIASETNRQLQALADERKVSAMAETLNDKPAETPAPVSAPGETAAPAEGQAQPAPAAPVWHDAKDLPRDGVVEGVPQAMLPAVFKLAQPGDTDVVSADNRVFLVKLEAVHKPDLKSQEATQVAGTIDARIGQSLQQDLFEYFARAVQARQGVTINQTAIDAVTSRM